MSRTPLKNAIVGPVACLAVLISAAVHSEPLAFKRTISSTNAVQAGVSGVGGGSGNITVAGVSGTVTGAYLYWHGINRSGAGAVYNNANILLAGSPVVGVSQGDASTNCWGAGSSRAYEANVTPLISGNGSYLLSGLSSAAGHSANGASLVVFFDDGDNTNNRDFAIFTGNDSSHADAGFPSDAAGWTASLPVYYRQGTVRATMHVADGQEFTDAAVNFATGNGAATVNDSATLFDGISLPNAGTSRATTGLYDVHAIDITPAFGATPGTTTLSVAGAPGGDCLALNTLVVDLVGFTTCAAEGFTGSKLTLCRQVCEIEQTPTRLLSLIKLYKTAYREDPACAL